MMPYAGAWLADNYLLGVQTSYVIFSVIGIAFTHLSCVLISILRFEIQRRRCVKIMDRVARRLALMNKLSDNEGPGDTRKKQLAMLVSEGESDLERLKDETEKLERMI